MTREETQKIIMALVTYYPNYKPVDFGTTIDLWCDAFVDKNYSDVALAVKTYVMSDTSGFAPSIGAINNLIATISERTNGNDLNELEAWSLVSKALRDSTYHSVERFNELPEMVQKAVGSPSNLHNWATTDIETIENVIASNFQRTYRAVLMQEKENRRFPREVRTAIEQNNTNERLMIEDV